MKFQVCFNTHELERSGYTGTLRGGGNLGRDHVEGVVDVGQLQVHGRHTQGEQGGVELAGLRRVNDAIVAAVDQAASAGSPA